MRAFARNTRNIFLTVILTTFLTAAPSGTLNFIAKFDNAGNPTANSIISDNGTNVGVGATNPQGKLDVNGNIVLGGNTKTQLSATGNSTVLKGGPIVLDLSPFGGGQLVVGNNLNDNKIFLEGFSSDGNGHASEILITGRFVQSLPRFTVLANVTSLLGNVQIGPGFDPAFTFQPSDASPNAGYIRFGDQTGWKLHFGRSRERSAGPLNAGTAGALMTIQDNGNIGIGTTDPTRKLEVAGTIRSSSGGFVFPDGTTQTTATLRGPQGPQGPVGPPGPPTKTIAVCGVGISCGCSNRTVTFQVGRCTVTSDTGSCFSGEANGCCAVCAP